MSLDALPQELVQNIASRLSDLELCRMRLTCHSIAAAIDAEPAHFWMYRHFEHYDKPRATYAPSELRKKYQERRKLLRSMPMFKHGRTTPERQCIDIIIDIVLDANPTTNQYGLPKSKNLEVIDRIVVSTNVLQCIFERVENPKPDAPMHPRKPKTTPPSQLVAMNSASTLQVLQLVLSSRSLSFITPQPVILSFEESQRAAYMDFKSLPMFCGPAGMEVNLVFALHIVNFFRYHMLRASEATLCPAFRDLNEFPENCEMPQLWKKRLSNDEAALSLGHAWKGSYAYLQRKEVDEIRRGKNGNSKIYEDHNVDLGHKAVQELEVNYPHPGAQQVWPREFEYHLKGKEFLREAAQKMSHLSSRPRILRSKKPAYGCEPIDNLKSQYFEASGWDDEQFWASGWVAQLPSQKNIPGFKRMVMMKYFVDNNDNIDFDALWAYEGIVLPGDQMIVGRWWSPDDPTELSQVYSGPFILWNTDCAKKYHEIHKHELVIEDDSE